MKTKNFLEGINHRDPSRILSDQSCLQIWCELVVGNIAEGAKILLITN